MKLLIGPIKMKTHNTNGQSNTQTRLTMAGQYTLLMTNGRQVYILIVQF